MLKIKCFDRDELINYLTPIKGKVPDNVAIISITDPDKQEIISGKGKSNILSLAFLEDYFHKDVLTLKDSLEIHNFLNNYVMNIMKTKKESFLYIQSEAGTDRSGAVAAFAIETLSPYELIDMDYYLDNNLTIQPSKTILKKLYTAQALMSNFGETYEKLPFLAWDIYNKQPADKNLQNLKEKVFTYLCSVFENESKNLK
jgi:hypothetical protein